MQDPQVSKANTSRADLGVSDRPFQCLTNLNLYGKKRRGPIIKSLKKLEIVAYAEKSLGVHLISHTPRTGPLRTQSLGSFRVVPPRGWKLGRERVFW